MDNVFTPKELEEASDPETTFQRLFQLSWHREAEVRRALVENPSIAVDEDGEVTDVILIKLAKEFPDEVGSCSTFALFGLELKEYVMEEVAKSLAENGKDPSILTLLLSEFGPVNVDVRRRIAMNSNTPPEVLRFLADKNNETVLSVRGGVTRNPNVPQDLLCFLADKNNEPSLHVRAGVARNPNTPEDVLRFLADNTSEPSSDVRGDAARALKERGLL